MAATRIPVAMNGAALGMITRTTRSRRLNRYDEATSRMTGSTWCTPYMLWSRTGHIEPRTTSKMAMLLVAPYNSSASGRRATGGTVRRKSMVTRNIR